MKRYVLHTPFSIYHFEAATWVHSVHKHTYFEIIFILKGNGIHNINGNEFRYMDGDVFLLGPEDYHHFEINEITEFCFIRFNESIYNTPHTEDKDSTWQQILKTLLYTSSQSRGTIVHDKHEREKLHSLLKLLEEENEHEQSQYFELIRNNIMRSMMIILARNLFGQASASPVLKDSVEAILTYIKKHIHQPAELTIEHLADVFNYAPDYISIFFKKHTGESLKQYITKYKMKLIETRLLFSRLTISEIADEFGYTDESHFCKQFKKFTGSTPTAFRKRD
ncbi:AraC family transcriptional regulator [Emticicia sp. TH156]|uniref:AraC family transcriptional regulator n=1 Tax=Emticicia sp. TH156 TaxID=2067454 RepID=UPI000C76E232|nr:AraC family transcriptional regulator [Emticicia sp. TH156]PLK43416.1 AraC family transcriptional regulator [Emticicia sp. TH156]